MREEESGRKDHAGETLALWRLDDAQRATSVQDGIHAKRLRAR